MVPVKVLPDLTAKSALSRKKISLPPGNGRIGQEYRTAFHIIRPEIKEPCDIVQSGQYMYFRLFLLHLFSHPFQLSCSTLAAIALLQHIDGRKGKLRPLLPDPLRKVKIPDNLTALLGGRLFIIKAISCSDDPSVKTDIASLRELPLHIFRKLGHRGLPHFHERDAASFQLLCGLNKITSVREQGRLVRMNHQRARRTGKTAEISAYTKKITDILTIVIIRGGNNIAVNPGLFHGLS